MIKTNCELPWKLLIQSNVELNDYDFVLFHLYDSDEKYRDYYKSMRNVFPDRLMIFDNSAYEYFIQGKELDFDKFYQAILDLKPDFYILPDVLMDKHKTITSVRSFLDKYKIEGPKPLAIAQGNSAEDLLDCLKLYKNMNLNFIGLPFHNSFFKEYARDEDIIEGFKKIYIDWFADLDYAAGRVQFVIDHYRELSEFKYIHLLGSHCPFEKIFYKTYGVIQSMDTGYPVKLGYENITLGMEEKKPEIIIDDIYYEDLTVSQYCHICSNIKSFKSC